MAFATWTAVSRLRYLRILRRSQRCKKVSGLGKKCSACQYQRSLCTDSNDESGAKKSQFDIATPKKAKKQEIDNNLQQAKRREEKTADVDPKLVDATHMVAESLQGDKDKVTGDLLDKLSEQSKLTKKQKTSRSPLSDMLRQMKVAEPTRSRKDPTPRHQRQGADSRHRETPEETIQPRRSDTGGMPDWKRPNRRQKTYTPAGERLSDKEGEEPEMSDMLRQMKLAVSPRSGQQIDSPARERPSKKAGQRSEMSGSFSDLLHQMKVEEPTRSEKRTDTRGRERPSKKAVVEPEISVGLYDGKGLGIFTKAVNADTVEKKEKSLFDKLEEKELNLQHVFPPSNAFEEEIQWTKQGKMWRFPVDNEEGMEDEQNVGFNEHVFLDQHLQGFPEKGPVRYFMDLVATGLSQNPYLTVQQKVEHIDWFRDYFGDKLQQIEQNTHTEAQSS